MKLRMVEIDMLQEADYNPARRTAVVADLVEAIKQSRYIRPLDVTSEMVIIDGHRRRAAAKVLGYTSVPCIIHDPEAAAVLYGALNGAVMRPSGNDNLHVYLSRPDAVAPNRRQGLSRMEATIGKDLMAAVAAAGGSHATYAQATRIANYCGVRRDKAWIKAITSWLVTTKQSYQARQAMESGIAPEALLAAVEKGLPLRRGGWGVDSNGSLQSKGGGPIAD